uniref:BRCT domain-containing protein n=1 Tax=Timema poppense TaxID=170557 RepID=A0A7R9DSZ1_TIMPO|nr:unnamed protein product [Timema poppensis]
MHRVYGAMRQQSWCWGRLHTHPPNTHDGSMMTDMHRAYGAKRQQSWCWGRLHTHPPNTHDGSMMTDMHRAYGASEGSRMSSTMSQSSETPNNIFKDTAIYIVSSGIGQMRLALFEKQIKTNGGKVLPEATQHLTHIILEENIFSDRKKCINLLNKTGYSFGSGIKIVGTSWLSECLSQNKLIDSTEFEFIVDNRQHNLNERVHPGYSSNNKSESEFKEDDKPSRMAPSRGVDNSPPKKLKVDETGFVGARTTAPCNELIISELQKLADAFRSYGDHWRVHGYERAVSAIGTYGKDITSSQEAHALPGVGAKMAAKVQEILDCGQLRKVQEICESEKTSVLELFTKVWGAGPSAAESWYQQVPTFGTTLLR